MYEQTTWSPLATLVTPGPTASMMPEPSWPPTMGRRALVVCERTCSSEWHRPDAMKRIRTSPARGGSSSPSVTSHGPSGSRRIAACVFRVLMGPSLGEARHCVSMDVSLDGKVALVAGAGPNIGSGIALALARYGARVACNDIDPDAAAASVRRIERNGGVAMAVPGDVSKEDEVVAYVRRVLDAWG